MKEVTTKVVLTVGSRAPDSNTRAMEGLICVKLHSTIKYKTHRLVRCHSGTETNLTITRTSIEQIELSLRWGSLTHYLNHHNQRLGLTNARLRMGHSCLAHCVSAKRSIILLHLVYKLND